MSKINLDKLRKISKKCSDNKRVQEYVCEVCYKIRDLLINYAIDTKQDENKILKKYLGYQTVPKSFSSGQIPTKYINYAIENGNIREQSTIITNFCNSDCLVILWAVEKNKYLSLEGINILKKRVYNLTGISSIQKFNKYIKKCEKCQNLKKTFEKSIISIFRNPLSRFFIVFVAVIRNQTN